MIQLGFGNTEIHIQIIPIYGLAAGVLYYNPNLEPDNEPVEPEEYFEQITIMLFAVGIHLTIWKQ